MVRWELGIGKLLVIRYKLEYYFNKIKEFNFDQISFFNLFFSNPWVIYKG